MRDNFREIAAFMDSVEPATNLRRLLEMHQLEVGEGYAEVLRRHMQPEIQERRFLFWNTFLMDFLRGITPDSRKGRWILGLLTLGASEIARITEEFTALLGKAVWERRTRSPHDRPFKPAVEERSKEIGRLVSRYASLSALCEVWTTREKEWLLDSWANTPRGSVSEISERQLRSSGLITISNDFTISKVGFHKYNAESGEDKLVGKGALLTRANVGFGPSMLDVYSTHLNAGNLSVKFVQFLELIQFIDSTRQPNNPAILVGDLNLNSYASERYSFVNLIAPSTAGAPSSLFWDALRLGDGISYNEFIEVFNSLPATVRTFVSGFNGTINEFMEGCMNLMGFKDLWKHRNNLSSRENQGYGYTTDLIEAGTADQICPINPGSPLGLCDELFSAPSGATRIDYMFVSNTNSGQSFTADFTRPKRFRADRQSNARHRDEMPFMSDHLGLITTMLISPR